MSKKREPVDFLEGGIYYGKIKIALFREYKIRLFLQEPTS